MPDTPKHCGCMLRGQHLYETCDWHKDHNVKVVRVTAMVLLTRLKSIFKKTHLRELEEEVLIEVKKFIK